MTMDRDALVERVAEAIYNERNRGLKNCWVWDDSGLDEEHPGTRAATMRLARAALAVIEPAVREECARVALRYAVDRNGIVGSQHLAAAIRALPDDPA